jgi:glutamine synthetase type III
MPTKKKILNFAIDDSLHKRLDDFRFNNRINTLSEAIRRLLDEALKKHERLVFQSEGHKQEVEELQTQHSSEGIGIRKIIT